MCCDLCKVLGFYYMKNIMAAFYVIEKKNDKPRNLFIIIVYGRPLIRNNHKIEKSRDQKIMQPTKPDKRSIPSQYVFFFFFYLIKTSNTHFCAYLVLHIKLVVISRFFFET